jgi:hypothetical protein
MDDLGNNVFSKTLGGFTQGENISYGVKFSFPGGVGITKYFQYEVGSTCALSITDVFIEKPILIYPNPTKDKFFVDAEGAVFVEVYDISGKKLQASYDKEQDISVLSPGVYFVKVNRLDTANHQLIKILKE